MPLLPPSTNATYTGAPGAARLLTLFAVLTIVPGCVHEFLPDGGVGTIAGLDSWLWKPGNGHHPPEHYAVLIALPVVALALVASLRPAARR